MTKSYDKHYQTKNYFGDPYPELIKFFHDFFNRGKVLDLGCGQGRNAISLAKLGYDVTGIDSSKVGIQQMLSAAESENLKLKGIVGDIYKLNNFSNYNFILLDSMFHFLKRDLEKEINLVNKIIDLSDNETVIVFCIRKSTYKVKILNESINFRSKFKRVLDKNIKYRFEYDGQISETVYKIIAVQK